MMIAACLGAFALGFVFANVIRKPTLPYGQLPQVWLEEDGKRVCATYRRIGPQWSGVAAHVKTDDKADLAATIRTVMQKCIDGQVGA